MINKDNVTELFCIIDEFEYRTFKKSASAITV